MTAPWGVEFQQNVLAVIQDNLIIIMRNNHCDGTVLLLRDRLRLDAGLDLTVHEVLHKRPDGLLGDLLALVKGEFLVLDGLLNRKGRPCLLEVQVPSMSTKRLRINGGEADDTLVFLGKRLQGLGQLGALFWSFGEDVCKRNTGLVIRSQ